MGQKTMQSGKKRRKIAKINPYQQGYFFGCRRFRTFFPGMMLVQTDAWMYFRKNEVKDMPGS